MKDMFIYTINLKKDMIRDINNNKILVVLY